jgi:predicted anti-sigma-YlaC factor YlaD
MKVKVFKILVPNRVMAAIFPLMGVYFRVATWMITCREFNDLMLDQIEEELSPKQLKLFERHMGACPMCHNFYNTYTANIKAAKIISASDILQTQIELPQDLLSKIEEIKNEKKE